MKNIYNNAWLHLIVSLLLFVFLFLQSPFSSINSLSYQEFNDQLQQKELFAQKQLNKLVDSSNLNYLFKNKDNNFKKPNDKGISFYVFKEKEPIFWSSRDISFSNSLNEFKKSNGTIILKNGWYQYLLKKKNKISYLAIIEIKKNYPITNKYLNNNFHSSFRLPSNTKIEINKSNKNYPIKSLKGKTLFYLSSDKTDASPIKTEWSFVLAFFLSILLFLSFLKKQFKKNTSLNRYSSLLSSTLIIFLISILISFKIPNSIFQQELFNPKIFAHSAILPSLGHFLLLTFICTIIIYFTSKTRNRAFLKNKGVAIIAVIVIACLPALFSGLIEGLVKNSILVFDTSSLFELTTYSFVGLFIIISLFVFFIIFIQLTLNTFSNTVFKDYQFNTLLIITSILSTIITYYFYNTPLTLCLWTICFILINLVFKKTKKIFYKSIAIIILASLTLSFGFIRFGGEKEKVKKEFLAKKFSKEQDPIAEYLFEELYQKIKIDTVLINNISNYWENKPLVDKHLNNKYFNGYWNKYDINIISSCQSKDTILIQPENVNVNCLDFFKEKIEKETDNPFNINQHFNFLYSEEGISSYLAQVKINSSSLRKDDWNLFIEFIPKDFSKTEGYPELLLDESDVENVIDVNKYSFAKYKNGKLVNNSGSFNYSLSLNHKNHFNDDGYLYLTFEKYDHLLYRSDKNTIIVISSSQKTIFNYITTFSYLFLLCFIYVFIIGLTLKITPFNWQIAYTDFSTKIQLFIIISIFLSFILFGWGTSYYIKKQNQEKDKKNIIEKVQSVLIELEHKLGTEDNLNSFLYEEMTYYLIKFSNVFYTDINLYDKEGELLASSRPEIYNIGLLSRKMEPNAYRQIHFNKKAAFIHQEKIGKLNYLSAYVPFRNADNKILAYMNLPYFAKQNELEKDLSSFFTALLNIYGLLFLISAIIAVFFANYISEPLRMIKDRLSNLQLGKSYEQIDWQSNDEIGALVLEYNKKVLELEHSAHLLVKSERESAWREMAKQVAHEIKNPLTPMKLSIQQLQRVAVDKPEGLTDRINRTAQTLIEQIETLTRIANEFSNFAKMPTANESTISVLPIIETTIDLFDKTDTIIHLHNNCASNAKIIADKNQISRVFNNLIKNALQAIPENRKGNIKITLNEINEHLHIQIKDNGIGIPKNKTDKIFVPNFTTKTTGMGLGLAIVKNIIEAANGTIRFETEENTGTTFFIELPIIQPN